MFFIGKVLEDTFWSRVFQNSGADSLFYCGIRVMESEEKSPECARANFTKSLCTLNSDDRVRLLSYSLNEH